MGWGVWIFGGEIANRGGGEGRGFGMRHFRGGEGAGGGSFFFHSGGRAGGVEEGMGRTGTGA